MAFNRNNQADLTALKNEVINDPAALGYAAVADVTASLLAKLNDNTLTGGATVNRDIDVITVTDVAGIIDSGEYDALSAYNKEWVKAFIQQGNNATVKDYKDKFLELFPVATSTTGAAANGLRSKAASRAEILFGADTVITRYDWIAARDKG